MKLSVLAGQDVFPDPHITGISDDSRLVEKGFLFAALPGTGTDGVRYIPGAERRGAAAVLAVPGARTSLPLVSDMLPRRRLAVMAARFYGKQPETVAGITGTNGKTSVARFCAQLWKMSGHAAGSLGTLGAEADGFFRETGLTTPGAVQLHRILKEMAGHGITHAALEVSSHALAQYRADGVRLAVAAFTNITGDHLDYHADSATYRSAKQRLFTELLADGGCAVFNAGGAGSSAMIDAVQDRPCRILTTGAGGRDVALLHALATPDGMAVDVADVQGRKYSFRLPLAGRFQVENALLAAGIVMASGTEAGAVIPMLERLESVPGRMQYVAGLDGAGIYVDYAHTPDAVAGALGALRAHAENRVIVVLGAGGDRDSRKRPLMGQAAYRHADVVIITDDNPRTENPASIRRAVLSGCPGGRECADRRSAIEMALDEAGAGDIVLIAGKGHERFQETADGRLPFDDAGTVRDIAGMRAGVYR